MESQHYLLSDEEKDGPVQQPTTTDAPLFRITLNPIILDYLGALFNAFKKVKLHKVFGPMLNQHWEK